MLELWDFDTLLSEPSTLLLLRVTLASTSRASPFLFLPASSRTTRQVFRILPPGLKGGREGKWLLTRLLLAVRRCKITSSNSQTWRALLRTLLSKINPSATSSPRLRPLKDGFILFFFRLKLPSAALCCFRSLTFVWVSEFLQVAARVRQAVLHINVLVLNVGLGVSLFGHLLFVCQSFVPMVSPVVKVNVLLVGDSFSDSTATVISHRCPLELRWR